MRIIAVWCVCVLLVWTPGAKAQTNVLEIEKRAYEAAQANPGDDAALAAYLAMLPKHRNLANGEMVYLVEGDLARSAREVRAYLSARQGQPTPPRNPELKLHTVHGVPMCWAAAEYRTIRFAVLRASFDQALNDRGAGYTNTLRAMKEAGTD